MPVTSRSPLLDFTRAALHGNATLVSTAPYQVVTGEQQWSYALSFPAVQIWGDEETEHASRTVIDVTVIRGTIGIGWTTATEDAYLTEKFVKPSRGRITLVLRRNDRPGRLIFRNAEPLGTRSEFVIHEIRVAPDEVRDTYPVYLRSRNFRDETRPPDGGTVVFDSEAAVQINRARLEWLESVALPVGGKRVLDAGAGVGHFARFYLDRGCVVTAIDGRPENIEALRSRQPHVDAYVADVQQDLTHLGQFEIVHCFGLLYHLESPIAALRNLHAVCGELLILETMVCDSSQPLALLADESSTANQALAGLGCRPTPSFIVLALNRVGFPHVYGATIRPRHPDFEFTWRDNLDVARDGHNLRSMFVATRNPLRDAHWVPLLDE